MPRRTITLHTIKVKLSRKSDSDQFLSSIASTDALDVIRSVVNNTDPSQLGDEKKRWWCTVDNVTDYKRACLVTLEHGFHGDPRNVVNTTTGQVTYQGRPDDAHLIKTRVLIVIPPGSTTGYYVVEREGSAHGANPILAKFDKEIKALGPIQDADGKQRDLVVRRDTVLSGDAWLETAELREVEAVIQKASIDVGDGTEPKPIPVKRREILEPGEDSNMFRKLFGRIRKMDATAAAAYLSIPDASQVDQIYVTGEGKGQTKKFLITKESSPPLRRMIRGDGEAPQTDREFIDVATSELESYTSALNLQWDYSWVR